MMNPNHEWLELVEPDRYWACWYLALTLFVATIVMERVMFDELNSAESHLKRFLWSVAMMTVAGLAFWLIGMSISGAY